MEGGIQYVPSLCERRPEDGLRHSVSKLTGSTVTATDQPAARE